MTSRERMRSAAAATCLRKVRHETRAAAERARADTARKGGPRCAALEVYLCPACKGWHVGRTCVRRGRVA